MLKDFVRLFSKLLYTLEYVWKNDLYAQKKSVTTLKSMDPF